jgi:outer membrane protein assembly factor BamB
LGSTLVWSDPISLDGSHSYDPDGDLLEYSWSLASKPAGSHASLSDATTASPSFIPDEEGDYVFRLVVRDGKGASDSDEVTVNAFRPLGSRFWEFYTYTSGYPGGDFAVHFNYCAPALDDEGVLYVGDSNPGYLYAINPDQSLKWKIDLGSGVRSSPAIAGDGTIYILSIDGVLHAVSRGGVEKWSFDPGAPAWDPNGIFVLSSPAVGSDGTVYVGSLDHNLYAIRPDGTVLWQFYIGDPVVSSPAIGSDGTVYLLSGGTLFAVNHDGTESWRRYVGYSNISSPGLGSDGTVYVASGADLCALDKTGAEQWRFTTGHDVQSSPVIDADGTIYIMSRDEFLYAVHPDGTEKWRYALGINPLYCTPAIGSDGLIYFNTHRQLHAVQPDGTPKWVTPTWDDFVFFNSPVVGNGIVYSQSEIYIYGFRTDATGLADSPWPRFKRDNRGTGSAEPTANASGSDSGGCWLRMLEW